MNKRSINEIEKMEALLGLKKEETAKKRLTKNKYYETVAKYYLTNEYPIIKAQQELVKEYGEKAVDRCEDIILADCQNSVEYAKSHGYLSAADYIYMVVENEYLGE